MTAAISDLIADFHDLLEVGRATQRLDGVGVVDVVLFAGTADAPEHTDRLVFLPWLPDPAAIAGLRGAAGIVVPAGTVLSDLPDLDCPVLVAATDVSSGALFGMLRDAVTAAASGPAEDVHAADDLLELADAAARLVGGPALIQDPHLRILAFSAGADSDADALRRQIVLHRAVPRELLTRISGSGLLDRVRRDEGVVRFRPSELGLDLDEDGDAMRLVTALRAGTRLLGYLSVHEVDVPLREPAELALLEVARLATVAMLRRRVDGGLEGQRRRRALQSLLDGDGPVGAELQRTAGIELPAGVLVVRPAATAEDERDMSPTRVLEAAVDGHLRAMHHPAALLVDEQDVVAVISGVEDGSALRRIAELLHDELAAGRPTPPAAVGISGAAREPADLGACRRDATRAAHLLTGRGEAGVATVADLWAADVSARLSERVRRDPALQGGPVPTLESHDQERGTEHLLTLRAFLAGGGQITPAARLLGTHHNTVRHRLDRIAALTGADLDDAAVRAVLTIQLLAARSSTGLLFDPSVDMPVRR